jgi:DNA-directed RNA polymerase subunit M/transcription elongation factor TFIIS
MLTSIVIILIALAWLMVETNFLRIRLTYGSAKMNQTLLLPAAKIQPILLLNRAKSRYELSMNMNEWDIYNKEHEQELERERLERTKELVENKRHHCPICKKNFEVYVKTQTFIIGNSTFTITGCPDCVEGRRLEVVKAQTDIRDKVSYKSEDKPAGKKFYEWEESEYPHTIEIIVDGEQSISVNGNYKAGMIKEFVNQYKAPKTKVGRKLVKV